MPHHRHFDRRTHGHHITPAGWVLLAELAIWAIIIAAAVHFL
jgi:hypothetical protein